MKRVKIKSIAAVLMAVAMILAVSPVVCAEDGEKINGGKCGLFWGQQIGIS